MNEKLKEKVKESLSSVLPITLIVLVLSVTLVPMEIGTLALFLTGAVLLIVGMGFFQLGAEMSMTPLGEGVGKTLAKREKVLLVVLVAFALGTIITIAEPDLQVLANQVASIPNNVLIWTVAVGVGVFLALAVLRILFRVSLAKCLLAAYALLFVLTLFSPKEFLAVAFDAGGVTTGPITVPFIMALGVGVSALRTAQDRSRQNISDDTLENFTTGGIADEASDGYTYCLVDGWYKKDIGETSYVLRRDKTGAQTVLWSTLDYRLKDICLYDDYLYMRGGRMKEPYGETVMRIPKTGGEPEILYKNTLGIETYTLYDGQLYILEMSSKPENYKNWSYRICRVENGQAKQIGRGLNFDQALFTDVLYGFGGKLYFIRDESSSCGLYAIDLETDKQELIYDGNFEEAVFYDNKLYFIPWDNHNYGHAFYRLSLTGGEPELLFDIPQAAMQSIALRCYHNTFYLVGRTSKAVWRLGMDGSLTQVASILTGLCQTLSFFDDQLVISVDEPQSTATEDNMLWSLSQPGGTPSIFIDWFRLPGEVRPAE